MTHELKPCPFCGNSEIKIVSNGIGDFYAICRTDEEGANDCGARSSDYRCETEQGAIDRWNTRAEAQPSADVVERAAAIVYEAFPFDGKAFSNEKPGWTPGGNSMMQELARDTVRKIAGLLAQEPKP